MVEKVRQHRTEIIIAIITALTGLSVAAIGNWDKLTGNQLKNLENNIPIDSSNKVQNLNEGEYSLFLQTYIDSKRLKKDGWTIENYHFTHVEPDSLYQFRFRMFSGYTYKFDIYSIEPNSEFEISLHPADEQYEIDAFKIDPSYSVDFEITYDVVTYFVHVIKGPKHTNFGLLITSKKTKE